MNKYLVMVSGLVPVPELGQTTVLSGKISVDDKPTNKLNTYQPEEFAKKKM